MLYSRFGINYNSLDAMYRRGSILLWSDCLNDSATAAAVGIPCRTHLRVCTAETVVHALKDGGSSKKQADSRTGARRHVERQVVDRDTIIRTGCGKLISQFRDLAMVRDHLLGAGPADSLAYPRRTQSETVDAGTWTGDHCARLDRRRRVSKDGYIVESRASPLNVHLAAWPAAAPQDTGLYRGTGSPVLAG